MTIPASRMNAEPITPKGDFDTLYRAMLRATYGAGSTPQSQDEYRAQLRAYFGTGDTPGPADVQSNVRPLSAEAINIMNQLKEEYRERIWEYVRNERTTPTLDALNAKIRSRDAMTGPPAAGTASNGIANHPAPHSRNPVQSSQLAYPLTGPELDEVNRFHAAVNQLSREATNRPGPIKQGSMDVAPLNRVTTTPTATRGHHYSHPDFALPSWVNGPPDTVSGTCGCPACTDAVPALSYAPPVPGLGYGFAPPITPRDPSTVEYFNGDRLKAVRVERDGESRAASRLRGFLYTGRRVSRDFVAPVPTSVGEAYTSSGASSSSSGNTSTINYPDADATPAFGAEGKGKAKMTDDEELNILLQEYDFCSEDEDADAACHHW